MCRLGVLTAGFALLVACGGGGQPPVPVKIAMYIAVPATEGHEPDYVDQNGNPLSFIPDAVITNADIADAAMVVRDGYPSILVTLSDSGAARLARASGANVGRRMAIVVDTTVVSIPIIRDRISGGKAMITGIEDRAEADRVARALRAGR